MNNAPRIAATSRLSAFFAAAFVTLVMLTSINGLATVESGDSLMANTVVSERA
jgi:hypothetical protein